MPLFFTVIRAGIRTLFMTKQALLLENLALRQQLAAYQRTSERARRRTSDRVFWVGLSRLWGGWQSALVIVKPETVIRWHRKGFQLFWRRKSRSGKVGRPRIPRSHIEFIKRMSADNPGWGEDRIALELRLKFRVEHSTSTIRRYMVRSRDPRSGHRWRTFIRNHGEEIVSCDFLIQHTAWFDLVYVFLVMAISTRRIVLINVTTSPTLDWVKQQIRTITAFGEGPRYLIHDNDGIFGQFRERQAGRCFRCHFDRWLSEVMSIKGIPIPYGAPNANAHVERFHRTLREAALNHFNNRARPSQAIAGIPDPYPELQVSPPREGKLVALPVLSGLEYDYRLVA
jgi:putative transposase